MPAIVAEGKDAIRDYLNRIEELITDCDNVPERGEDFATSVSENARNMSETIAETEIVTKRQATALENWEAGISKWLGQ